MNFLDTLTELWNTPSVDYSDILREEENGEILRQAVETGTGQYQVELSKVLTEFKFKVTFNKDGQVIATRNIDTNTYIDENNNQVIPMFINGIPTLKDLLSDPSDPSKNNDTIFIGQDDADDYKNRFISLDARRTTEDGSDISFIRIITNDEERETVFPNFDKSPAPGITSSKFKQFILTQLSTISQERMQIVETNDKFQLLFFGEKPEVLQLGGVLKNTLENPWSTNMLFLWDELMRGTKLVENGQILQIATDGELYTGYPFNFQRSKVAPNDFLVNFSFSFIIRERTSYNNMLITPMKTSINKNSYKDFQKSQEGESASLALLKGL